MSDHSPAPPTAERPAELTALAVTGGREERATDLALAATLAAELGVRLVARRGRSVARLLREEALRSAVVVAGGQPVWRSAAGGSFAWHPNMAVARLRADGSQGHDLLLTALEPQPGQRVLDATCGLGADALVVGHAVGPGGLVVGVEASPVIAALARWGLATYQHRLAPVMRALRVVTGRHDAVLAAALARGERWDAVLFDPMFDRPVAESAGLAGLRELADPAPLGDAALTAARAVAARVVVKGRRGDPSFERLQPERLVQSRKSRIGFAVWGPLPAG